MGLKIKLRSENFMNLISRIFLLTTLIYFLNETPSYAYLDAGTISYFLQFLIAGIVGGLFFIKLYFKKIKAFFSKIKKSH
jgi:hypothetical protein